MKSFADLDDVQRWIVRQIIKRKTVLLTLPMGAGKTICSLSAVRKLFDQMMIRKVLVIAPKNVATDTWPPEIRGWKHTRVLSFSVLVGTPAQRKGAAAANVDMHIINYSNLPWLWGYLGENGWDYDMLIWDEPSRLKGGRKRTKPRKVKPKPGAAPLTLERAKKRGGRKMSEFGCIARARAKADYVVGLTGTPSPKGMIDLWAQLYFVDHGKRLGASKNAFERRYFDRDFTGFKLTLRDGAFDAICNQIRDVVVGLPPNKSLTPGTLPPIVVEVQLPPAVMKQYKAFERTMVAQEYDVEAVNRGVLENKLLQFANGSLYNDERNALFVHDVKLQALDKLIRAERGNNVLIAYEFQFDRLAIQKKYPHAVVIGKEPGSIEKWNRGEIEIAIGHPASIGHGLNLQFGGHIGIHYGVTNNLEWYLQFNMRLDRRGQQNKVKIYHIIAKGTRDEKVYKNNLLKEQEQNRFLEAMARTPEQMRAEH